MKLKGRPNFFTYVVGIGKIQANDKGFIEATNSEVITTLKMFGFEEIKEEPKEEKKAAAKPRKKGNKK